MATHAKLSFDLTLQHPKEVSSHNIYKSKNIAFAVMVCLLFHLPDISFVDVYCGTERPGYHPFLVSGMDITSVKCIC